MREWSESINCCICPTRIKKKQPLDQGADDYHKTFCNRALARIRVALRHYYKQGGSRIQAIIQVGFG